MEVRHLQKLFRPFHTPDIEDSRIFQLLLVPPTARMFDGKESEIELCDEFASGFGELRTDLLRLFEFGDIVASEAAVTADEAFTREQILLVHGHGLELFSCFDIGGIGSQKL